ncbi:CbrC family protein [Streptomyces sp. NBC_01604]|uniref:hypothetical protein n=1 Tax=Streptomyces sp. NBC_01604 TaxID=2975894 RepID=UPI00386C761A
MAVPLRRRGRLPRVRAPASCGRGRTALETLAADHDAAFLAALDAGGRPTAYLFRCRRCARHLAYADFT